MMLLLVTRKQQPQNFAFQPALEQNESENASQLASSSTSARVKEREETADRDMKSAAKENKEFNDSSVAQIANDNICNEDLLRLKVDVSALWVTCIVSIS